MSELPIILASRIRSQDLLLPTDTLDGMGNSRSLGLALCLLIHACVYSIMISIRGIHIREIIIPRYLPFPT